MLKAHPGFNTDFVIADDDASSTILRSTEPEHSIQEIKYGHVGREENPKKPVPITPELKKALAEMMIPMAKEMAEEMAKVRVQEILKDKSSTKPVLKKGATKEKSSDEASAGDVKDEATN